jgi:stress-induced morphogen
MGAFNMATITRGTSDQYLEKVKTALEAYEQQHAGAAASLYRQSPGSIRVRVIDPSFAKLSKSRRHDLVWDFISDRVDDDTIQEISILLLLTPAEETSSVMNEEFNDPIPSGL